jgi:multiple sugar transport system permease protein
MTSSVANRARPLPWIRRQRLVGVLYAAPTAIMVAVFFVVPLLVVTKMSASDWPLLTGDRGFNFPRNYSVIASNPVLGPAISFTITYTVVVTVLLVGLGLGLALLVQPGGRWVGLLRIVFLLPLSVGLAAASLLFWGFYSPQVGPLNPMLQDLGLIDQPIQFLGTPTNALLSTVFLIVWKYVGLYMLILLVGLQAIPRELYEAASIDGASAWQTFRRLTLPLLRPSIALALILCVTGSLLAFDQFFLLTYGGPGSSTVTVVYAIYREAFLKQNLGAAAALSIVLLLALLLLNAAQFRGLRRGTAE